MACSWHSPFLQAANPYCLGSPDQISLCKEMLLLTQHILQPCAHPGWAGSHRSSLRIEMRCVLLLPRCRKRNGGFRHPFPGFFCYPSVAVPHGVSRANNAASPLPPGLKAIPLLAGSFFLFPTNFTPGSLQFKQLPCSSRMKSLLLLP